MSNTKKSSKQHNWAQELERRIQPQAVEEVSLTVIIPTYNCSEVIATTLDSLQKQNYENLEVIVIDAGSDDRTAQIVNSFSPLISRIYTTATFNIADMINRGISLAAGQYITPLLPGSFYISEQTLHTFSAEISQNHKPDLLYCGSIQREVKRQPRTVYLPFDPELLEKGQHPATLSACWFRADLFDTIGKFDSRYQLRSGFEFFCRLAIEEQIHPIALDRVYVDFDYGRFSYGKALRFASETWRILQEQFGFKKALKWFVYMNHLQTMRWLWRRFKLALAKK